MDGCEVSHNAGRDILVSLFKKCQKVCEKLHIIEALITKSRGRLREESGPLAGVKDAKTRSFPWWVKKGADMAASLK